MKHHQKPFRTIAHALAVLSTLALSTGIATAEQSYSSVAEARSSNGWAFGYGLGHPSLHNADVSALNECNRRNRGNCSVTYRFRGKGCAAIAKGSDGAGGWGAGHASRNDAETRAVNECNGRGQGCRVTSSDCTGG